jgi:hypothetical protein
MDPEARALDLVNDMETQAWNWLFAANIFDTRNPAFPEDARDKLIQAWRELRPAYDHLAKLAEADSNGEEALRKLLLAAYRMGQAVAFTDPAIEHAHKVLTGEARTTYSELAAARKPKLREAILQAAGATALVNSIKFARSLHESVCAILGVKPNDRGYSPRTIQREISAILENAPKVSSIL